jgi:NAD(P)-dependent dehydrogenase (short-subunit alcohol dehydrogenase family)
MEQPKYHDGVLAFLYRQLTKKIHPNPYMDLSGKEVLITGGATGIGLACTQQLVGYGARVVIAVRNVPRGEEAARKIIQKYPTGHIEVKKCDLESLESTAAFVDECVQEGRKFDTVILNAAILAVDWELSSTGHEMSIQVNLISNAFLALSFLHHKLFRTPSVDIEKDQSIPRLLMIGSEGHAFTPFNERKYRSFLATLRDKSKFGDDRYMVSKLLFMLWTMALEKRVNPGDVKVIIVSPGFAKSELFRKYKNGGLKEAVYGFMERRFARSAQDGATQYLYAAEVVPDYDLPATGWYFSHGKQVPTSKFTTSMDGVRCQEQIWSEISVLLEKFRAGITHW